MAAVFPGKRVGGSQAGEAARVTGNVGIDLK
jgi:hypothetical protein